MTVSVREVVEDGITYRITEDPDTGFFLRECIDKIEVPAEEQPIDEITQLKLAMAEMADAYERDITTLQLALAEIVSLLPEGGGKE